MELKISVYNKLGNGLEWFGGKIVYMVKNKNTVGQLTLNTDDFSHDNIGGIMVGYMKEVTNEPQIFKVFDSNFFS